MSWINCIIIVWITISTCCDVFAFLRSFDCFSWRKMLHSHLLRRCHFGFILTGLYYLIHFCTFLLFDSLQQSWFVWFILAVVSFDSVLQFQFIWFISAVLFHLIHICFIWFTSADLFYLIDFCSCILFIWEKCFIELDWNCLLRII